MSLLAGPPPTIAKTWSDAGYYTLGREAPQPDTVLAPDVAFVRQDRLPASGLPAGFWRGAPDLAVEVLSPGDSPREVEDKTRAWLETGTPLVLVIDAHRRTIMARRAGEAPSVLAESDVLDAGDVVPGFLLPVAEVFPA